MHAVAHRRFRLTLCLLAALALPMLSGCIGAMAQFLYMWKGITVPAEYTGLKGKKVAVVCVSTEASYGPASTSARLARAIELLLRDNVPKITILGQDKVGDWIDRHNWDQIDYREIGRGVGAEMVVAVDLREYRLREGSTLLKGRASATITVFDMTKDGEEVFVSHIDEYSFPRNGYPTTEMSLARFERAFMQVLSHEIARKFYESDFVGDFARDPASLAH